MKRAGPLQQRRGFGKALLLQPYAPDQRHQFVAYSVYNKRLHKRIGRLGIASLQVLPSQGDGGLGIDDHGGSDTSRPAEIRTSSVETIAFVGNCRFWTGFTPTAAKISHSENQPAIALAFLFCAAI
jgi:hypothetical protein